MKFYKGLILAIALAVTGIAQAGSLNFAAATDGTFVCDRSCTSYTASDPTHTVDSVYLIQRGAGYYDFSVSVDGKVYSGTGHGVIPAVLTALDGSYILASASSYNAYRVCARSGRATVCVTGYSVYAGTVSIP